MVRYGIWPARLFAQAHYWETQVDASCYVMDYFRMQAGSALGNIASVLGVPSEEAAIVSELKAGSEEAFAWLIAKYHQPIYSLVARTIPDPADAADLTQDVKVAHAQATVAQPAAAPPPAPNKIVVNDGPDTTTKPHKKKPPPTPAPQ